MIICFDLTQTLKNETHGSYTKVVKSQVYVGVSSALLWSFMDKFVIRASCIEHFCQGTVARIISLSMPGCLRCCQQQEL